MKFSFDFYRYILGSLSDLGFNWKSFKEYSQDKYVYLRHDMDIFPENAVNMAKVERDLEATAIYFFQPNCEFYNLLSPSILHITEKLSSLGHEIGLHIDAKPFKEKDKLIEHIHRSYDFYSKYIPLTNIISFHRPPAFVMESFDVEGFTNVYGKKYFKEIRYFSDSKRREFSDQLFKSLSEDKRTSIQLLTHPYWWDHISLDLWEDYERFIKIKTLKFQKDLQTGFKPYERFFDERFVI